MHGVDPSGSFRGGPTLFRFSDFEVDTRARTLTRAGRLQALEPKAFHVLQMFVSHPNELLTHQVLLDEVWDHRFASPRSLTRLVAQLRRVLNDDAAQPRYIRTRHSLGYCFIGELLDAGRAALPAQPVSRPAPPMPRDRRGRLDRRLASATAAPRTPDDDLHAVQPAEATSVSEGNSTLPSLLDFNGS